MVGHDLTTISINIMKFIYSSLVISVADYDWIESVTVLGIEYGCGRDRSVLLLLRETISRLWAVWLTDVKASFVQIVLLSRVFTLFIVTDKFCHRYKRTIVWIYNSSTLITRIMFYFVCCITYIMIKYVKYAES